MFWALARVSFRAAKIVNKNFFLHGLRLLTTRGEIYHMYIIPLYRPAQVDIVGREYIIFTNFYVHMVNLSG
jgi:hypothetical protein